jgi:acetyl-CoA carboxylase alpha subunit
MTTPKVPTTESGKALLNRLTTRGTADNRPYEVVLAAIEAEAAAAAVKQEREQIAERVREMYDDQEPVVGDVGFGARLALRVVLAAIEGAE